MDQSHITVTTLGFHEYLFINIVKQRTCCTYDRMDMHKNRTQIKMKFVLRSEELRIPVMTQSIH